MGLTRSNSQHFSDARLSRLFSDLYPLATPPSPLHGRSVAAYSVEIDDWIHFKGGGCTWGRKRFLNSRKDNELILGLYDLKCARREAEVSAWFDEARRDGYEIHTTCVLGWLDLEKTSIDSTGEAIGLTYANGVVAQPVVLLTACQTPYRLVDLLFFDLEDRKALFEESWSSVLTPEQPDPIRGFAECLGQSLAHFHRAGGSNDTLVWDNVTIRCEWTDFEWMYAPGVPLPCGSTDENLIERQWKNCLDAMEIIDRLVCVIATTDKAQRCFYMDVCLTAYEQNGGPSRFREDWGGDP